MRLITKYNMSEKLIEQFKENITLLLEELIEQINYEEEIIMAHILIKNNQVSGKKIIQKVGASIHKYENLVKNRDEEFFKIDDNIIASIHPSGKSDIMKRVWESNALDDEDKQIMWEWVDTLLHIYKKYITTI